MGCGWGPSLCLCPGTIPVAGDWPHGKLSEVWSGPLDCITWVVVWNLVLNCWMQISPCTLKRQLISYQYAQKRHCRRPCCIADAMVALLTFCGQQGWEAHPTMPQSVLEAVARGGCLS